MIRLTSAQARSYGVALPAKGEPKRRGPNKWESEFAAILEDVKRLGKMAKLFSAGYVTIDWWGYEPLRLKLADGTYYTPDFVARSKAGDVIVFEVKGFLREAARVRFNVAKRLYPWMKFIMIRKVSGQWEEVKP